MESSAASAFLRSAADASGKKSGVGASSVSKDSAAGAKSQTLKLPPAPSPGAGLFPTEKANRDFYILWVGFGVTSVLASFGCSILFSQAVGFVFIFYWILQNVGLPMLLGNVFAFIADLFFKEIASRGVHKIPQGQGVVLACAPH